MELKGVYGEGMYFARRMIIFGWELSVKLQGMIYLCWKIGWKLEMKVNVCKVKKRCILQEKENKSFP